MNYPHPQIKTWVKMPNTSDVLIKIDETFYINPKYYAEIQKAIIEYRMNHG